MTPKPWQRWTILALLLSLSLYSLERAWSQDKLTSEERMKRDIYFLASEECEGRGPGTKGIDKAADYIVQQFKEAGLKPGGVTGTWFQPFTISSISAKLEGTPVVKLQGPNKEVIELKAGKDFEVMGNSASGNVSAPLVFAGYGTSAKDIDFDEYKNLDVAGKVVIVIRRVPRFGDKDRPFDGKRKDQHATLQNKFSLAQKNKAAAVILVNDASEEGDKLMTFGTLASAPVAPLPAVAVRRAALEPVFQTGLKRTLPEIEKAIDAELKPLSSPVAGWSVSITCKTSREPVQVKNVLGVLEGSGPLADETVVVGAHYDHLGYGDFGSLAPRRPDEKKIHFGADDNGSGSTSVMELARRFGAMKDRQGRRIVFMTYSAEERGLLGSRHYCREPIYPLDKTVAMVNLDMVGRLSGDKDGKGGKLTVEGVGTGKGFEQMIDQFNDKTEFQLNKRQGAIPNSDHDSFYQKKIPIVFFFSGFHPQYHTPKDTADLINVNGMKRIADLAEMVIAKLASDTKRPEFVAVSGGGMPIKIGDGPKLGIRPDYGSTNGLTVDGVTAGGIADTAGMKAGDVIVEMAGKQVKTIQDYTTIMAAQKVGQTIDIVVLRDNKKVTLKANLK